MVKFIPAICTQCGAKLQVPDNLKEAFCYHCGTKFVTDSNEVNVHHKGTIHHTGNIGSGGSSCVDCGQPASGQCHWCKGFFCREHLERVTKTDYLAPYEDSDGGRHKLVRNQSSNWGCKWCASNVRSKGVIRDGYGFATTFENNAPQEYPSRGDIEVNGWLALLAIVGCIVLFIVVMYVMGRQFG